MHNIYPTCFKESEKKNVRISLDADPFTFFALLCDSMQHWNRPYIFDPVLNEFPIIIRYKYQWKAIHKQIWREFHKGNNFYIADFEKDYVSKPEDSFIIEKPIVYYRNTERKREYEVFGLDIFNIVGSEIGYSSIHYIINYDGNYIEVQVRTIFDEAWSECDHDFVYKLEASPKKLVLERSSKLLSEITGVADNMSRFMSDYFHDKIDEPDEEKEESVSVSSPPIIMPVLQRPNNITKVSDIIDMF